MKQKNLYYVLVICLVIISVLITILFMSHQNSDKSENQYTEKPRNVKTQNYGNPNYRNPNYGYPNYEDIDYGYDYNGNWFQPSRWWNNLWHSHNNHNRYYHDSHRRRNYDRQDGLNIHNRYNFIQNQPTMDTHSKSQSQPQSKIHPISNVGESQKQFIKSNSAIESNYKQPRIELVKPESGSDFPFPTLSSSSHIMPEEIAMSPMPSTHIENGIHSKSAFTSDIPMPFQTTDYNFDYKGPDLKNHKPFPVDMMASESIYLQPNTVPNEIIIPPVVMDHPNPM
jgi:hypothetical protein